MIPGAPIAVRKDLPESLKVAIAGSLLKIDDDPEALQILQNGGYRHTSDKDYDMVRYLKRLKAELSKKK
jgi:phosphonate transport system substrate-binding protein